jgi:hypothetical protein
MSGFLIRSRVLAVVVVAISAHSLSVHPASFPVTITADAGAGTLRQAIIDANVTLGIDTITFNIGGTGPHIILPTATGLPTITDRTVIDGYSQPGSTPNTLTVGINATINLQIDGSLTTGAVGLGVGADSCVIRGFSIVNWHIGILLSSSAGSSVQGCFIGVGPNGTSAPGNLNSGVLVSISSRNLIGGTQPEDRNLISGNDQGILIGGGTCIRNRVEGNYIGTDRTGTLSRGNRVGITISNGTDSNIVGGTATGAGNLVSGNDEIGIALLSQGNHHSLYGNWVGVNSSGTGLRANGNTGIYIDNSGYNLIGSGSLAGRNVVAGSVTNILVVGDSGRHNQIIGNYVGTDITGTAAFNGQSHGIRIDADSNTVGGAALGQRNVIGGHTYYGIWINGPRKGNVIRNNLLGIGSDLVTPIPNANGIRITGIGSTNIQIGGKGSGDGNVIRHNAQEGILLDGDINNSVLGNSIASNGGLGIDIWPPGVNPNDVGDPDTGPNDLQNFPVLTTATDSSGVTLIRGTLNSQPLQSYYVQIFTNSSGDPSGFGEGSELLDTFTLPVGLSGTASISRTLNPGVPAGTILTATATNSGGSTSEFSNSVIVITGIYSTQVSADTADVYFLQRADLDRDNRVDFVYTGNTKDSLYVAYGKSDGTVEAARGYYRIKQAAVFVDFLNHDNLLDIIARTGTKLYVLLNQGSRNFSIDSQALASDNQWGRSSASVNPSVAGGFFNGDAFRDIVATPSSMLFGDGTGGFGSSSTLPLSYDAVDAGDFNRDGYDDLAVTMTDSLKIYLNNGAANFSRVSAARIAFHGHDISSVKTGFDFNGDGGLDMVALSGKLATVNDTSTLFIGFGDGAGGLGTAQVIDIFGTAVNFAVSDVDKDNDLDVSVVNSDSSSLVVYINNAGSFLQTVSTPIPLGFSLATALASADLNRDGSPDALVGGQTGTPVVLAINQLPPDPVLPDEMVTTGYDNAQLTITNPKGLGISPSLSTVAGSAYWRYDVNGNPYVDDQAYDYNLQYGEYRIVARPSRNAPIGTTWGIGIGIDGSQQAIAVRDYSWNLGMESNDFAPQVIDSLVLYFPVAAVSPIQPAYGVATGNLRPTLFWPGLETPATTYQLQLDRYYDFRSPIYDVSALSQAQFAIPSSLGKDSVFYWRVKRSGDANYSHPFALFVAPDACCKGSTGNVDCDPGDGVDISDLSALIDNLYITLAPLCCKYEANVDGSIDGNIDISDLSALIDNLYISFTPLAACR